MVCIERDFRIRNLGDVGDKCLTVLLFNLQLLTDLRLKIGREFVVRDRQHHFIVERSVSFRCRNMGGLGLALLHTDDRGLETRNDRVRAELKFEWLATLGTIENRSVVQATGIVYLYTVAVLCLWHHNLLLRYSPL